VNELSDIDYSPYAMEYRSLTLPIL